MTQLLGWGNVIFADPSDTNVFFFRQVFLVQVNPGETFTIRAEDGTLQCIQGKRTHGRADERSLFYGKLVLSPLQKRDVQL